MNLATTLMKDDRAFVVTIELLLIVSIVVIGLVAGLSVLRNAIVNELGEVSQAISEMDQRFVPEPNSLEPVWVEATTSNATHPDNCIEMYLSPPGSSR